MPTAFGENAVELKKSAERRPRGAPAESAARFVGCSGAQHSRGRADVSPFRGRPRFSCHRMRKRRCAASDFSSRATAKATAHWRVGDRALDFFDLKGAVEALDSIVVLRRAEKHGFALAAEILLDDKRIGFAGQLSSRRTNDSVGAVQPSSLPSSTSTRSQTRPECARNFASSKVSGGRARHRHDRAGNFDSRGRLSRDYERE